MLTLDITSHRSHLLSGYGPLDVRNVANYIERHLSSHLLCFYIRGDVWRPLKFTEEVYQAFLGTGDNDFKRTERP